MTYEQANELLVTTMQTQNYAPDTQKKFKASLSYLCSFHTRYKDVENITTEEIQDFLNHLAFEKSLSPSTVNNYQAALKFLLEHVFKREWQESFLILEDLVIISLAPKYHLHLLIQKPL